MHPLSFSGFARWVLLVGSLLAALFGCKPTTPASQTAAQALNPLSSPSCAQCHATQFEAWKNTDHALANRLPRPEHKAALASFPGGLPANPENAPLMIPRPQADLAAADPRARRAVASPRTRLRPGPGRVV